MVVVVLKGVLQEVLTEQILHLHTTLQRAEYGQLKVEVVEELVTHLKAIQERVVLLLMDNLVDVAVEDHHMEDLTPIAYLQEEVLIRVL